MSEERLMDVVAIDIRPFAGVLEDRVIAALRAKGDIRDWSTLSIHASDLIGRARLHREEKAP